MGAMEKDRHVDLPGYCEDVEEETQGEKRKREVSPVRSEQDSMELRLAESPEKKVRQENMNDTPDFDEYEEMARADKKLCRNGFTLPYLSMLRRERDEEEAE